MWSLVHPLVYSGHSSFIPQSKNMFHWLFSQQMSEWVSGRPHNGRVNCFRVWPTFCQQWQGRAPATPWTWKGSRFRSWMDFSSSILKRVTKKKAKQLCFYVIGKIKYVPWEAISLQNTQCLLPNHRPRKWVLLFPAADRKTTFCSLWNWGWVTSLLKIFAVLHQAW